MEVYQTNFGEEIEKKMSKLMSFDQTAVINLHLLAGDEIKEHATNANVVIVVQEGEVVFDIKGEAITLTTQRVLYLHPNEPHALRAIKSSRIVVLKIN